MARTKELVQELEEENNERMRELMELEGFGTVDEKRSEIEETLQKLTEGQRKFLLVNYGNKPAELKK